MRRAALALVSCLGISGCVAHSGLQARREAAIESVAAGAQECIARHTSGELRTWLARETCINAVEDRELRPLFAEAGGSDLLELKQTARISIANKLDQKRITEAAARVEFAKAHTQEEVGRSRAAEAAVSQESCSRRGNTISCF